MTSVKRKYKTFTKQFKEETVALVKDQGYTVQEAVDAIGIRTNQIYNWKQRIAEEASGER
jgi:transposase